MLNILMFCRLDKYLSHFCTYIKFLGGSIKLQFSSNIWNENLIDTDNLFVIKIRFYVVIGQLNLYNVFTCMNNWILRKSNGCIKNTTNNLAINLWSLYVHHTMLVTSWKFIDSDFIKCAGILTPGVKICIFIEVCMICDV